MPPWWSEPVTGLYPVLDSNLSRDKTHPIQVQFLGVVYNTPKESLPWYNTLVWTLFVTPVGFLVLAGLGLVGVSEKLAHRADRNPDRRALGVSHALAGLAAHAGA